MRRDESERELLIALLAHRRGLIDRAALLRAIEVWIAEGRRRSLKAMLLERGLIPPAALGSLEAALDRGDRDVSMLIQGLDRIDPDDSASIEAAVDAAEEHVFHPNAADPTAATVAEDAADAESTRAGEMPTSFEDIDIPDVPAGRYRILRPLARGGLGEVYVARDDEVERVVALKVMRREVVANDSLRERFVRESEINGNLEHPGIIPVYGKGEFDDGRPYYAMRLVEGGTFQQAIEKFHRESGGREAVAWEAAVRPLLRRFLVVCEAIAYAHGRGVLHRDLKPSNVLLGPYGETLIIDWGLAKLHSRGSDSGPPPEPADASSLDSVTGSQLFLHSTSGSLPTQAGQTLGSPPFMSPEQARGEQDALGEASDVYGLGATLYNLLAGKPPIFGESVKETLRRVREGRIDPVRQLEPRIPKALAAICGRAMQLEPEARYPSARTLADDLEHWLADEPVSAHRDGWTTRLARWGRRHRVAVAATLGLLVAGLVGLSISNVLVGREKDAVKAALHRDETAEAKTKAALGDAIEAQVLARDHLHDGMDLIRQFVELGDRHLLARLPTAERRPFLVRSLEFARRFRDREPENYGLRQTAADVERRLGNLARLQGQLDQSAGLLRESVDELASLPESEYRLEVLARTHLELGDTLALAGRLDEAEVEFRHAAETADQLVTLAGDVPGARRARALALDRLGSIAQLRGDPVAAEAKFREALSSIEPLVITDPEEVLRAYNTVSIQPLYDELDLVGIRTRMAEATADAGHVPEGRRLLDEADATMAAIDARFGSGRSRDVDFYRPWVAIQLARARNDADEVEGVADTLRTALDRLDVLEREDPGQPPILRARAEAFLEHARAARAAGRAAEAEADARATLELLETASVPDVDLPVVRAEALLEAAEAVIAADPKRGEEARGYLEQASAALADAARAGVRPPRSARLADRVRERQSALAP